MAKRLTTKLFIEKSTKVYSNKYDYSKVEYINNYTEITIICPEHGEFLQMPYVHINGHACKKCGAIKNAMTKINNCRNTFVDKARKIHGDKYDYSKVEYINSKTPVCIICPEHGEFSQTPSNHLKGTVGCNKCAAELSINQFKVNAKNLNIRAKDRFIAKANKIHNNKYDYTKSEYINGKTPIIIICPVHGEFEQAPRNHHGGNGCILCRVSKGELKIINYLSKNSILFESQKTFDDCKDKRQLLFDFWLPKHNILIEFDGQQHFEPIKFWGGGKTLENIQRRDAIKTVWAKEKGIHLLRIPYTELNNIDQIINKYLARRDMIAL